MKKICCLKNPQHSVNDIDIVDTKKKWITILERINIFQSKISSLTLCNSVILFKVGYVIPTLKEL